MHELIAERRRTFQWHEDHTSAPGYKLPGVDLTSQPVRTGVSAKWASSGNVETTGSCWPCADASISTGTIVLPYHAHGSAEGAPYATWKLS